MHLILETWRYISENDAKIIHDEAIHHICCTALGVQSTLRLRQNGRCFADNIFKCILFNEYVWIAIKISRKFDPEGPINNIPSLIQKVARRQSGNKSLSDPLMVYFTDAYYWHIYASLSLNELNSTEQWDKLPMLMLCMKSHSLLHLGFVKRIIKI